MDTWRHIVQQHLGRKSLRHIDIIKVNIVAVDAGIKPAFLYDVGEPCGTKLLNMLLNLKQESLIKNNLNVLAIGMDCLIVNVEELTLGRSLVDLSQRLVDVSRSVNTPCICSDKFAEQGLKDAMVKLLETLDCTRVTLSTLSCSNCNVSSLFGLLLNYPIIYWYDESDSSGANCLSMEKLISVQVTAKYFPGSNKSNGSHPKCADGVNEHCLYSFSYPASLECVCKPFVEQWFSSIQDNIARADVFSNVKMNVTETVVEAVNL